MRSVNKVILIGNLTRDPELRQTQSGQPVTTFSIATNRVWVTKDSKRQTSTEYHDLVAWSRLAEICHKYLKKSKLVYVEGYLKTRSWDTPEGIRKFKTEVVVQDMIMLDKRQDGEDEMLSFGADMDSGYDEPSSSSEESASEEAPAAVAAAEVAEEATPAVEMPAAEAAPVAEAQAETPAPAPATEEKPVEPAIAEPAAETPATPAPAAAEAPSNDESVF